MVKWKMSNGSILTLTVKLTCTGPGGLCGTCGCQGLEKTSLSFIPCPSTRRARRASSLPPSRSLFQQHDKLTGKESRILYHME